jgi:hypothetical protein
MRFPVLSALFSLVLSLGAQAGEDYLFILSGQSNMEGLNPESSFLPELKKLLPDDRIHHVKFAQGGQPIRKWVKNFDEIAKKNKLPAMNDPGKSSTTCTTPRKAMTCSVSAWRGRRCG